MKLHTLLDLHGSIPTVAWITAGSVHDVNILDELPIEPDAIYGRDRGYLDFARLRRLDRGLAWFVTRARKNFRFRRLYSASVDTSTGRLFDQTIVLHGYSVKCDYPDTMRRFGFFDAETNRRLVFLTNNFALPASTIVRLYPCRWRVELFFKWIKQNLRIKAFYGTSENAVKTQIRVAISVYVRVAIVKKRLNLTPGLYTILQILSVTVFEKTPILSAFSAAVCACPDDDSCKQLNLFD